MNDPTQTGYVLKHNLMLVINSFAIQRAIKYSGMINENPYIGWQIYELHCLVYDINRPTKGCERQ